MTTQVPFAYKVVVVVVADKGYKVVILVLTKKGGFLNGSESRHDNVVPPAYGCSGVVEVKSQKVWQQPELERQAVGMGRSYDSVLQAYEEPLMVSVEPSGNPGSFRHADAFVCTTGP